MAKICPTCGRKWIEKQVVPPCKEVPEPLRGLSLFEHDSSLCGKWGGLVEAWRRAFPSIDIVVQVRLCHAWLLTRDTHVWRNNVKGIYNWLKKAQGDKGFVSQAPPKGVKACLIEELSLYAGTMVYLGRLPWEITRGGLHHPERGMLSRGQLTEQQIARVLADTRRVTTNQDAPLLDFVSASSRLTQKPESNGLNSNAASADCAQSCSSLSSTRPLDPITMTASAAGVDENTGLASTDFPFMDA